MNLLELLKKLKEIEPDKHYTQESRSVILSTPLKEKSPSYFDWPTILSPAYFKKMATFSIGLTVLVIIGGAVINFLSPVKFSSLDPATLKAEAEAIDIQIHLANLTYTEETGNETTLPTVSTLPPKVEKQAQNIGIPSATSSISDFGIDDILEKLSN